MLSFDQHQSNIGLEGYHRRLALCTKHSHTHDLWFSMQMKSDTSVLLIRKYICKHVKKQTNNNPKIINKRLHIRSPEHKQLVERPVSKTQPVVSHMKRWYPLADHFFLPLLQQATLLLCELSWLDIGQLLQTMTAWFKDYCFSSRFNTQIIAGLSFLKDHEKFVKILNLYLLCNCSHPVSLSNDVL